MGETESPTRRATIEVRHPADGRVAGEAPYKPY
jgi:hypothetical protein